MPNNIRSLLIVKGGLGNQMFQAAFGHSLESKFKRKIYLVSLTQHARISREWSLDCFNIDKLEMSYIEKYIFMIVIWLKRKALRFKIPLLTKIAIENKTPFSSSPESIGSAWLIDGYWQSYIYFHHMRSEIKKIFTFPPIQNKFNPFLPVLNFPKIAIHVRRGDYIADPVAQKSHLVCDVNWYRKAWHALRSQTPSNSKTFIFSDDIEWAKTNINFDSSFSYIENTIDQPAWVDMSLMASCDYFIISNSSYSWWSAYLGEKNHSIVIAPKFWYPSIPTQALKICPTNWQLL